MIHVTAPDTTEEIEDVLGQDEELSAAEVAAVKAKSVSGAVSYFFRTILLQAIGLVSAFALSYFFSAAEFGVYGIVIQIFGLLSFIGDVGLAASLIQKKAEPTLKEYRSVFTVQQLLSWFIFAIILGLIAVGFVRQKTGWSGDWILLALGLSFPLASLKTISAIKLERELAFSTLVIPHIIEQIVFHVILIFLAWRGMGAIAYAYAISIRSVLGTLTMFALKPWSIGVSFDIASLRGLLKFGVKFQLNDLIARVKDNLFLLFLGFVLPLEQFGYIQWAKMWSMYPYTLTVQNIMAITFPTFSRLQKNPKDLSRAIETTIFFSTLAIFPLLLGMSLFFRPLLDVFPAFSKWLPTMTSFVFFTLSIGWAALSTPLTNTLNAIGHINATLKLMIFWTVLTWILTPLAVWIYGYHGAAIAAFIISSTSFIPVLMVKKIIPINAFDSLWRQLVAGGIMSLVGLTLFQVASQNIVNLVGAMAVTGLAYIGAMLVVGRQKLLSEIAYVRNK